MNILLILIFLPSLAAIAVGAMPGKWRLAKEAIALAATSVNLAIAILSFGRDISYSAPWAGYGFEFSLRLYNYSAFTILAAAALVFLVTLFSSVSLFDKKYAKLFYAYLLVSLSFLNGAVLADNLIAMLFFWEGFLMTMFGMIYIGNKDAFKTATKAFIILGSCDLCLVVGIALSGHLAGTFTISKMSVAVTGLGGLAFVLLAIGAIAKAGSMPFHSWIPDAALDAPLPFMAVFPAALEKLVGIYLLTRICLDMFKLNPHSWLSYLLMIIGSITIILAVMMALIQKDYKRLLSYHAISQVGYMILGIGTMLPVAIVGGIFHMLNNAMYKCCLFLTGGAVEKQAGSTDLEKLGGIARKMPVTFACFLLTALAISGVPPFNGFFSKELVYDGALERGWIFYLAAVVGSFFTAASFLKLGHAAYLGPFIGKNKDVKEAPAAMLVPMIVIAAGCIVFGIWNAIPIKIFIQPILGQGMLEGHDFAGLPKNMSLVVITIIVLAAAVLNHLYGVWKTHSGLRVVDHIHYAPILADIYDKAEKRYFDPFNIGMRIAGVTANLASLADRAINWVYDVFSVRSAALLTAGIRRLHTGNYSTYIIWSVGGAAAILMFLLK
jgi:formate hydrogenlyase subunit 3/multisubunit Na+/H+ antiporter MnhD subunit